MTLVLDTSILIDIERREKRTIAALESLARIHPSPAKITFMNHFEFLLGIKEKSLKNKDVAREFLNKLSVMQTTKITGEILSELKQKYDQKGVRLSLADLIIASLVIENNHILVTKDKDFEKIDELKKIIL